MEGTERKSKFMLGLYSSIDKNTGASRIPTDTYTGYATHYDQNNYTIGLGSAYTLTSRLSVNLSVAYANRDFTATYYCDVCDFITAPLPMTFELSFVQVPIGLNYYFLSGAFRPFLTAAITNQFSLDKPEQLNTNTFVFGGKLGGGAEYNFTSSWALQIEAAYANTTTHVFKNADSNLEILSLKLGIFKRF